MATERRGERKKYFEDLFRQAPAEIRYFKTRRYLDLGTFLYCSMAVASTRRFQESLGSDSLIGEIPFI